MAKPAAAAGTPEKKGKRTAKAFKKKERKNVPFGIVHIRRLQQHPS